MLKISIPAPCHEDWNKMTPDETGRHCSACAKSVIDFTGMSDHEVQNSFLNKKEERVCGRFKQTQLQRIVINLPQNIFSMEMPVWKKFLAACLIVFSTTLFSCEININEKTVTGTERKDSIVDPISDNVYVGGISYIKDTISVPEECAATVGISILEYTDSSLPDNLKGAIDKLVADPVNKGQIDSQLEPDRFLTGDTILMEQLLKKNKADSATNSINTKNPPKADSTDCNTIKNYY